jgi:hypothetical protein
MASYIVVVDTRDGDKFRGIYPKVSTRDQVLEGVRTGTDPTSVTRLVSVVKAVRTWPNRVVTRKIEIVRVEAVILGKVVFEVERSR